MNQAKEKSIFYPPGGILINILIYVELVTYGLAISALVFYGVKEREAFQADSATLDRVIGTVNTLLLLTSGYLVALGIKMLKENDYDRTARLFNYAMLFGLGFLLLKIVEYGSKLDAGLDLNHSTFFMFYWLLTGFHWIHVLVGLIILFFIRRSIVKKKENASLEDAEAGAAFWHMCDIIWLLLFPALYLIFQI